MSERKSIAWFRADPDQPRKTFDDAELRQLGESVKAKQLYPVICKPDGTLIDGERRWRAAQMVGLETLACIVMDKDLSESEVRQIQLASAIHRADLKGWEKWKASEELLGMNPAWKLKDLGEHLHIEAWQVTRLMAPSRVIPAVQEAFIAERLGISDVYALSKMSEKEQHQALALALNGATRDQLEQSRQRKKRKPARPRLVRLTLKLGGVGVTVAAKELSLEGLIGWLEELRQRAVQAKEAGLSLKSFECVLNDKANHEPAPEA